MFKPVNKSQPLFKIKKQSNPGWDVIKEVLNITKELSDAYPPLKSTVSGVLAIMDQCDNVTAVRENIEEIANDIRKANELLEFYSKNSMHMPIPIQNQLERYVKAINLESAVVQKQLARPSWSRILTTKRDTEKVFAIVQKLGKLENELRTDTSINTNINVEQILSTLRHQNLLPQNIPGPKGNYLEGTRVNTLAKINHWIEDPNPSQSILWLSGVPGCGKSTLMGVLHRDLAVQSRPGKSCLAAFVRFDRSIFHDPSVVVKALSHELAAFSGTIGFEISQTIYKHPGITKVVQLSLQLKALVLDPLTVSYDRVKDYFSCLVVIVDGLDECLDQGNGEAFQEMLQLFSENLIGKCCPYIRLIVASRPIEEIILAFEHKAHILSYHLDITDAETKSDIKLYLETNLEKISDFLTLPKNNLPPNGQQYILNELSNRASGLFIWAVVAMRFISGYPSGRLQTFLSTDIPENSTGALSLLYETALDSIAGENDTDLKSHICLVLGFTKCFHQEYTLGLNYPRLQSLLNYYSNNQLAPNIDLNSIIRRISSLLVEGQFIELIHKSLDDYLTDKNRCKNDWYIDRTLYKLKLANACSFCIVEHIQRTDNMADYEGEGRKLHDHDQDFCYASENWALYLLKFSPEKIYQESYDSHLLLQKYLLRWLFISEQPIYNEWATLGCNVPYSLMTLVKSLQTHKNQTPFLSLMADVYRLSSGLCFIRGSGYSHPSNPTKLVIFFFHFLCASFRRGFNALYQCYMPVFVHMARGSRNYYDIINAIRQLPCPPLLTTSVSTDIVIQEIPEVIDDEYLAWVDWAMIRTPTRLAEKPNNLTIAIMGGRLTFAKYLFANTGSNFHHISYDNIEEILGANLDQSEIVKVFNQQGVDANALNYLEIAAMYAKLDVVKLLIQAGAVVDAPGNYWGNALQAAASQTDSRIVELLIQNGANVNAVSAHEYKTALHVAVRNDRVGIVKVLLNAGANVNFQMGRYGLALQLAALLGNRIAIVKLLVAAGADVNARGGKYGSVLHAAVTTGDATVVQFLIENGANVNAPSGGYNHALQRAAYSGHLSIVQMLVKAGADVNAKGRRFGTALEATASNNLEIRNFLIEHGANING
ncbi:hypothetical protein D9757_011173 [Collybiopsis confluens]|uniref:Nephrocystin 3-like N-terminal domain-containing protein n=1 Tax=Collybiopsis confluens TaxID=2823264 RepID=A0A8H5H2M4_9AGAR|nr:hypothetical protein D9757_011173 [Collybiopsis confluens]